MAKHPATSSEIAKHPDYDTEFRRIYSDLYPDERALEIAIAHYKPMHPNVQLAHVDVDPEPRIGLLNWFLRKSNEREPPNIRGSSYTFADIKTILDDGPIDMVYLTPAAFPSMPSLSSPGQIITLQPGNIEEIIGKCICGLRNNGIEMGNFANVLWQGGWDWEEAAERGLVEYGDVRFKAYLNEPTYQRPILVITHSNESETMINRYNLFLGQKGIGVFASTRTPRIPGFNFMGENHRRADGIGYVLDHLSFF